MILQKITDILQQVYNLDQQIDPYDFLINRDQYDACCQSFESLDPQAREAVFAHTVGDTIHIALYISPDILSTLNDEDPLILLSSHNLEETCIAIEGISHLLYLIWKIERNIPCSHLELELQAEIDKFILCRHWLKEQGQCDKTLSRQLFESYSVLPQLSEEFQNRYDRASWLAHRYCHSIHTSSSESSLGSRLPVMRHFYRMTHWQKIRHCLDCFHPSH